MTKRQALGRGLGALIPGADEDTNGFDGDHELESWSVVHLPVDTIEPNPFQPRTTFDQTAVDELAASIEEKGVLQPISVRRWGSAYQLIAGERRLRACKAAGIASIPAILIDATSDQDMLELSLIENIQRKNLNPVEEARAYRSLIDECDLTQEEVAQRVSKDRSSVANTLRLLALPRPVLSALEEGSIGMGHARTLLGLGGDDECVALCNNIISKGLSVRQVEALVKSMREGELPQHPAVRQPPKDPLIADAEEDLRRRFGTAVHIRQEGKVGKIEIEFYSVDDLNRLLDLLK